MELRVTALRRSDDGRCHTPDRPLARSWHGTTVATMPGMPLRILVPLALCTAALLAALGLLLAVEHPQAAAAPDYRTVNVGGLEYESMLSRNVDPAGKADARIAGGVPVRHGTALFGAFISVTNDSSRALPMADRIELRDLSGHVYRPIRLPAANRYAYRAHLLHARTRIPRFGTPADDNLSTNGLMLLYRIPAWQSRNGQFELLIHNPRDPASTASLIV
jgi:hypothetical protein